jgi:hypothetical protein
VVCETTKLVVVVIANEPDAVVAVKVNCCDTDGVATKVNPLKVTIPFTACELVPASM